MKLFTIVVLLCAASLIVGVRREKSSSKTKGDEGSGSWNDGFNFPRMRIGLDIKSLGNDVSGKFFAKNIENPTSKDDKFGLVITPSTAINTAFQKVMVQSGNNWIIPYRFMGRMVYERPGTKQPQEISGLLTNDADEHFSFKLYLPYKSAWCLSKCFFISPQEAQKLVDLINKNALAAQTSVKEAKDKVQKAASDFISNSELMKNLQSANAANAAAEKKRIQDTKKALEENNKNEQIALTQKLLEIQKSEAQISKQRKEFEEAKSKLDLLVNSIKTMEDSLELFGKKNSEAEGKIKAKVTSSQSKLDAQLNILNELTHNAGSAILTSAKSAVISTNKMDALNTALNNIKS